MGLLSETFDNSAQEGSSWFVMDGVCQYQCGCDDTFGNCPAPVMPPPPFRGVHDPSLFESEPSSCSTPFGQGDTFYTALTSPHTFEGFCYAHSTPLYHTISGVAHQVPYTSTTYYLEYQPEVDETVFSPPPEYTDNCECIS